MMVLVQSDGSVSQHDADVVWYAVLHSFSRRRPHRAPSAAMSEHVYDNPAFVDAGVDDLMASADSNHDGSLQESEWLQWCASAESLKRFATKVNTLLAPVLLLPLCQSESSPVSRIIERNMESLSHFM